MVNCLIEIDVATGQDELQKPIYLNPSIVLGDHAIKPVPNLRRTACIRYSLSGASSMFRGIMAVPSDLLAEVAHGTGLLTRNDCC